MTVQVSVERNQTRRLTQKFNPSEDYANSEHSERENLKDTLGSSPQETSPLLSASWFKKVNPAIAGFFFA
jgi:hypothetical protein